LDNRHMLVIDIFARSDAQRLDLADYVVEEILRDGWVYNSYSHASGNKSQIEGSADGRIYVTNFITNSKLSFGEQGDPKDRYRQSITVNVRKSR
jgi:hypothetical protein